MLDAGLAVDVAISPSPRSVVVKLTPQAGDERFRMASPRLTSDIASAILAMTKVPFDPLLAADDAANVVTEAGLFDPSAPVHSTRSPFA